MDWEKPKKGHENASGNRAVFQGGPARLFFSPHRRSRLSLRPVKLRELGRRGGAAESSQALGARCAVRRAQGLFGGDHAVAAGRRSAQQRGRTARALIESGGIKNMPISKQQKAVIHVAKSQLHMADEDYRALLLRVAGVRSSSDLEEPGFEALMAELERLGFRLIKSRVQPGRREGMATPTHVSKNSELWKDFSGKQDDLEVGRW